MVVPQTTRLQFLVVRPGFWLSVLGNIHYNEHTCTKVSLGYKLMDVRRTTESVFVAVWRCFLLSQAHGQPKF